MEAENLLAEGFVTRVAIESRAWGWSRLRNVAHTSQPARFKGVLVSPEFGTPFLAATQVYHIRPTPRKWLSIDRTGPGDERFVDDGTILVTRSGSVGRATLALPATKETLISDDLLRVKVHQLDWWGWVYAYLRAPSVREIIKTARYGHIIKHLETHHLDELPVVRPHGELRSRFSKLARKIVELRERANSLINEAEAVYQDSIGQVPLRDDGTSGFVTRAHEMFRQGRRLEGNFHNPAARAAERAVLSATNRYDTVGELAERIFVPGRFKHIYGADGVPYLDSAQITQVAPDIDKRVLSLRGKKQADYLVDKGTLLIPCSGQLHGIIGSVVLATDWHEKKVLTNHILRIVPKSRERVRVGYLQAVLSHPLYGRSRVLKGAFGSSVPELAPEDIALLTVPRLSLTTEDQIADAMEQAATDHAQANMIEEQISGEADDLLRSFLTGDRKHFED